MPDRVYYECPTHGRLHPADYYQRADTARTVVCRGCDQPAVLRYKPAAPIPPTARLGR